MGVASLVLGIISLVISFIPTINFIGIICGILGIVLAVVAKKKNPSGVATAGLVLSIIGLIFSALFFVACASVCTGCGLLV